MLLVQLLLRNSRWMHSLALYKNFRVPNCSGRTRVHYKKQSSTFFFVSNPIDSSSWISTGSAILTQSARKFDKNHRCTTQNATWCAHVIVFPRSLSTPFPARQISWPCIMQTKKNTARLVKWPENLISHADPSMEMRSAKTKQLFNAFAL